MKDGYGIEYLHSHYRPLRSVLQICTLFLRAKLQHSSHDEVICYRRGFLRLRRLIRAYNHGLIYGYPNESHNRNELYHHVGI